MTRGNGFPRAARALAMTRRSAGNAFMHSAGGTDESVPYAAQCQFRVIPSGTKWSRGIFAFGFCFADLRCEDPSARLCLGRDDVGMGNGLPHQCAHWFAMTGLAGVP